MSALLKKVGLVVILFDLLVGVAGAAVLHQRSAGPANGAKMSASRLEQVVAETAQAAQPASDHPLHVNTTCTADPTDGWDYYCVSSDGSRALYDVSADGIAQHSQLPSYR
jgi:hypothetical protein